MSIILASTSAYRKTLLLKAGLSFSTQKPEFDEETAKSILLQKDQTPLQIAEELSLQKTLAVAQTRPTDHLTIGGDQLVEIDNSIIGKPHTHEKALSQLQLLNGRSHRLITSVTLIKDSTILKYNHITTLKMKQLSDNELESYLRKDSPYDCAGSYKIEEHGIILFESIDCDDFTAIQGLPMIWLSNRLKEMGYEFFKN